MLLAATVPGQAIPSAGDDVDLGAGVGAVGLAAAPLCRSCRSFWSSGRPGSRADVRGEYRAQRSGSAGPAPLMPISRRTRRCSTDTGLTADLFDHVLANPPFQVEGEGRTPPDEAESRRSRNAGRGYRAVGAVMCSAGAAGGTATLIHRAEALPELAGGIGGRFGGLVVLPIHPRRDEAAVRVIVAGRKGSQAPMRLLPAAVRPQRRRARLHADARCVLQHGAGLDLLIGAGPGTGRRGRHHLSHHPVVPSHRSSAQHKAIPTCGRSRSRHRDSGAEVHRTNRHGDAACGRACRWRPPPDRSIRRSATPRPRLSSSRSIPPAARRCSRA